MRRKKSKPIQDRPWQPVNSLDDVARNYVLLVLRIDKYIPGFNDYYYGPPDWKQGVDAEQKLPVGGLRGQLAALLAVLASVGGQPERLGWFRKQFIALDASLRKLQGEKLSIAEQARLMFDLEFAPPTQEELDAAPAELDRLLPGPGALSERVERWRDKFRLSDDKLTEAYLLAFEVTRTRTHSLLLLPRHEQVDLHFVKNKPWDAYHWFQGNARSYIEVNTDVRALASTIFNFTVQEAYPGHHTDYSAREQRLYHERDYLEWCVSPLFTPMSTMAEALAQLGTEIVLTPEERLTWHRDVFFPALGVTGVDVEVWMQFEAGMQKIARARERVPFMLYDEGKMEEEIVAYLQKYALMSAERAHRAIAFHRKWGAYTFSYTVGRQILRRYLATGDARGKFVELLTTPIYPSLVQEWVRIGSRTLDTTGT